MRLKLTIAYDGAPFSGWQKQPNAVTVQELIETAISEIAHSSTSIHGSGRTDTGVHANGQVAHFDAPNNLTMNPYNWVPALNSKLPPSIRILECEEVAANFHARFSAIEKHYRYEISLQPILHPHLTGRIWHIPHQIDPEQLEIALSHYLGTHCFKNFSALRGNESEDTDYTRTIYKSSLEKTDQGYSINFRGSGFLYKMVRILTGEAIKVAQWKLPSKDHQQLLTETRPQHLTPTTAPAAGLTLESVKYS